MELPLSILGAVEQSFFCTPRGLFYKYYFNITQRKQIYKEKQLSTCYLLPFTRFFPSYKTSIYMDFIYCWATCLNIRRITKNSDFLYSSCNIISTCNMRNIYKVLSLSLFKLLAKRKKQTDYWKKINDLGNKAQCYNWSEAGRLFLIFSTYLWALKRIYTKWNTLFIYHTFQTINKNEIVYVRKYIICLLSFQRIRFFFFSFLHLGDFLHA